MFAVAYKIQGTFGENRMYPHEIQALMAKIIFVIFATILVFMNHPKAATLDLDAVAVTKSFPNA